MMMIRTLRKQVLGKKWGCLASLMFFSGAALASVPNDNLYAVKKRTYAAEPELQRFTISGHDKAFLLKPNIATYTQLNPLNPKAIYTVLPYPHTEFLPELGKWMTVKTVNSQPTYLFPETSTKLSQASTLVPAHWISLTNTRGQYIIEPINYAFIVYEDSNRAPLELLNAALRKAGFSGAASKNHSGGYYAYIGGKLLGQVTSKAGRPLTYSNRDFQFQNDHFRIFGVYPLNINKQSAYIFITSISEESGLESGLAQLSPQKMELKLLELNKKNANGIYYENYGHHFVSFAGARNNLAVALIEAGYSTYYSALGNVVNTLGESTEDHDGNIYITVIK